MHPKITPVRFVVINNGTVSMPARVTFLFTKEALIPYHSSNNPTVELIFILRDWSHSTFRSTEETANTVNTLCVTG